MLTTTIPHAASKAKHLLDVFWEHIEVVQGVFALGESVAGAAALREERVVLVFVRVLGRSHEQHVLQVVRQALRTASWSGA